MEGVHATQEGVGIASTGVPLTSTRVPWTSTLLVVTTPPVSATVGGSTGDALRRACDACHRPCQACSRGDRRRGARAGSQRRCQALIRRREGARHLFRFVTSSPERAAAYSLGREPQDQGSNNGPQPRGGGSRPAPQPRWPTARQSQGITMGRPAGSEPVCSTVPSELFFAYYEAPDHLPQP